VVATGEVGFLTQVFNTLVSRLRERESQAELERLSVTDALTGLYNRRHLMETLSSEAQRSRRLRRPFSVLLADVDHFKQYNDTHGHIARDAALTKIADILRKTTRAVDCVARYGGALRVAMIGEPPTLDAHVTTATITREIGINMFETLYTLDAKYQPVPLLVESHELQDGGRRYVLKLRRGVKFHNGKELGAADVVASLTRWGAMSSPGKAVWKTVAAVEARDASTVEIRLKEPSGTLLTNLAQVDNAAVIYPKEVIDASAGGQLKEYIGTGPFKFVEHKPDRHVKLARFDGYVPRREPSSGLAGQRIAYLDELVFLSVPDLSIRQAG